MLMNTSGRQAIDRRRGTAGCGQPRRRGAVLIYSLYMLMCMCAIISVAVDYGRVQVIKTQMQRAADITARGALQSYVSSSRSLSTAQTKANVIPGLQKIDGGSGIAPTVNITWGYWNNKKFKSGTSNKWPLAVKVEIGRTTANGNAVPLTFPLPSGNGMVTRTCDVWASSVAILPDQVQIDVTIDATDDPWLSGMPAGSTASYNDTAPANVPRSIAVTPGSTLQFTNVEGAVKHGPTLSYDDAEGDLGAPYMHMEDSPDGNYNGVQNGIGNIKTPIDSLIGVFLDASAPSTTPAPSTYLDYSTQAARDKTVYNNLQNKQPFFIGDGKTSSTTQQTFLVPAKATRLFLGPMDGYEWSNNGGSFTATIWMQPPIQTVQ